MSYSGLPYIHAVFDVAAWLASMTVFWWNTRHLIPSEALPANRVAHPGLYAVTAGCGALVRRDVLRHGQRVALRDVRSGLLHGRRHRRRHRRDRGLNALHRPARLDRLRLCRTACRRRRGRPHRLLLRRPRRLHLRHADRVALGRRFRRRHRAPSGAALRSAAMAAFWSFSAFLRGATTASGWQVLPVRRLSMRCSASSGNSSSPTARWSGRSTCFTCLSRRSSCYAWRYDRRGEQAHDDAVARKSAPYVFLGQTTSLCETCLALVPAKIVERGRRRLYSRSAAAEHGVQ